MNTRRYHRTLDQAFPFGAECGCAIQGYSGLPRRLEKLRDVGLAVIVGVVIAAVLVQWWAA